MILQLQGKKEEKQQQAGSHPLVTLSIGWVLPVIMGVFFNVVAPPTHTQYLLAMFNATIGAITCILYMYQTSSLRHFLTIILSQMTVLSFFIKSSMVSVFCSVLFDKMSD